ncbi:hypothetical protein Rs2_32718 [Raphanus sativus]|nr:hypothetical protein Rs2_32718 [Raphanus sativus]
MTSITVPNRRRFNSHRFRDYHFGRNKIAGDAKLGKPSLPGTKPATTVNGDGTAPKSKPVIHQTMMRYRKKGEEEKREPPRISLSLSSFREKPEILPSSMYFSPLFL